MAMSGSVFVVATIRAGERAPDALVALWKDGVAQRLELTGLPRSAVMELLGSVLGGYIETTTQYNLWDACQGNALLLHELVLGGVECGALRNEDGVWRWKERPAAGRRMIEVVQSRLATLTEQERDLVEALAIGEPLDARFAERLAPDEVLLQLESRGLIQLESTGGQAQVRLAHPLYGEALRGRSSIRTRWLKRRLAAAATASNNLRPDDVLRVATWQLDAGDDVSAEVLTTAAERAELLFAHELAERLAMAAV